jgi:phosphate starvation-inducible protein PhoH
VVRSALRAAVRLRAQGQASRDGVVRAVKVLSADSGAELAPIFTDTVLVPRAGRPIAPRAPTKKQYVDQVRANDIVFGVGPAGQARPTWRWRWRCARSSTSRCGGSS